MATYSDKRIWVRVRDIEAVNKCFNNQQVRQNFMATLAMAKQGALFALTPSDTLLQTKPIRAALFRQCRLQCRIGPWGYRGISPFYLL